jgi:hypothetical protein
MSSRTLLIDRAQVSHAPRFVRDRAHLIDEVWLVTHESEKRHGPDATRTKSAFRDGVIHVLDGADSGRGRELGGE